MKKSVLILTLNDYIIYQPSILNLYDFLLPSFDVTIVSFQPEAATKLRDETRNVIYLKTNYVLKHIIQKLDFVLAHSFRLLGKFIPVKEYFFIYYNTYLPYILRRAVVGKKLNANIIIAADLPALEVGQKIFGKIHLISLEIENRTNPIYNRINYNLIRSVFIQSKERYDYLFPGASLPVFYVQNAPVVNPANRYHFDRKDYIWAGAMERRLAVLECIQFFDRYPQYRLVLKGGGDKKSLRIIHQTYGHLLKADRICIDRTYLPGKSFLEYLSHFKIGICFYSWDLINSSFNYATAPSGKLFMYLAAGIPVIACDIPGFKLVNDFHAGILINDFKAETIFAATQAIESDYNGYVKGCYEAADHFSFDKQVAPYIKFLTEESNLS